MCILLVYTYNYVFSRPYVTIKATCNTCAFWRNFKELDFLDMLAVLLYNPIAEYHPRSQ